jgi:hypothetical protein
VVDTRYISTPMDIAGIGQTSADVSAAVLAFQSKGIDRVIFNATGGGGPFFFLPQAESQNYHPKYSIGSWDYPQTVIQSAPQAQLVNMSGISWVPTADLAPRQQPKPSAERLLCRKIVLDAGGRVADDAICDSLFLIYQALKGATAVDPQTLRLGVEALGAEAPSLYNYRTRFTPQRHDASAAYRDLSYDAPCQCFVNSGSLRPMP